MTHRSTLTSRPPRRRWALLAWLLTIAACGNTSPDDSGDDGSPSAPPPCANGATCYNGDCPAGTNRGQAGSLTIDVLRAEVHGSVDGLAAQSGKKYAKFDVRFTNHTDVSLSTSPLRFGYATLSTSSILPTPRC